MPLMLSIDASSGTPVYLQIMEQVKRGTAIGILGPGDQLPTAKQLAHQLSINPNTVLRAYRQLEQEGVIEITQGRGTFVRGDRQASAHDFRLAARSFAETTIQRAMHELLLIALPKAELRKLVLEAVDRCLDERRDA